MMTLKEWCEAHYSEQLDLLKTLAAIPAPSNKEEKRAAFIASLLTGMGMKRVHTDSALNVILSDYIEDGQPFDVYMAHTDVVFPDTEPLPVREDASRLYAPGVGDDTANAVALIMIVKYLKENGMKPAKPAMFVWNSGEEGLGNLKGVRAVMGTYGASTANFVSFDGGWREIVNAAVGSERWKITVKTEGGHSYARFGAPNAIAHMAKFICGLYEQKVPKQGTTYNVGVINGGTSVNTIAESAEMLYEYRSDDFDCLEAMRRSFDGLYESADCAEASFTRELVGERPCGRGGSAEDQRALEKRVREAITGVTHTEPQFAPASTDANIPLSMGIPAVTFGLYIGSGAHTRDEYIEKDSLTPGLLIGLKLVLGVLDV